MIRGAALALLLTVTPALAQQAPPPAQAGMLMAPGLRVSNVERSLRFYTKGLGLAVGMTLKHGTLSEIMLGFGTPMQKLAVILLHDEAPGKSPPILLGNGFAKIVVRMADLAGVAARIKAAGFAVGEVHKSSAGPSVLMVSDPDGYTYELVEMPAPRS